MYTRIHTHLRTQVSVLFPPPPIDRRLRRSCVIVVVLEGKVSVVIGRESKTHTLILDKSFPLLRKTHHPNHDF